MSTPHQYSFDLSVKSDVSDELINVYVMRPAAGVLVRAVYHTPITPNQITLAATIAGLGAAALYVYDSAWTTAAAGVCIVLKDFLDSADGQLARAKGTNSRSGRFLDSIGDFLVNLSVLIAVGYVLTTRSGNILYAVLALLGFLGLTLRVSYHVYYQTAFLHTQELYATNRITEEVRKEDLQTDRGTVMLQHIFQALYGWQDRLMVRIDGWCRRRSSNELDESLWFADRVGLRLSGFLGLGTELLLLTLCSVTNHLSLYLYCNIIFMNGIGLINIWYRWRILADQV